MTWLVWRQHRQQALLALLGLAAVGLFVLATGAGMWGGFRDLGLAGCLDHVRQPEFVSVDATGCGQELSDKFLGRYQNLVLLGTVLFTFLPMLAGMFWGAPVVARELEHGTHRLVWTQGITRLRWAAVKLGLLVAGVVVVAALYCAMVSWWFEPFNRASGMRFSWLVGFDQQGIAPIGYTLFAFALGVLGGTVTRRTLPAMVLAFVGFLGARIVVTAFVRPRFLPPLERRYGVAGGLEPNALTGDWLLRRAVHSAQGVQLTPGIGEQVVCSPSDPAECVSRFGAGAYNLDVYQPAGRYWLFQGLETALFALVAALLLVLAVRFIRRRVA